MKKFGREGVTVEYICVNELKTGQDKYWRSLNIFTQIVTLTEQLEARSSVKVAFSDKNPVC